MASSKVEVNIDGGLYTIVSETEKANTEEIALFVDKKIKDIRNKES